MRILSWNIQWGRGCDGRVDFDRIAAAIRGMADLDLICLQEVAVGHSSLPGSRGEDQCAELRERFPGYSAHYAVGSDLLGDGGSRRLFGNMILSRLPVLQVFRHTLPWPADGAVPNMPRVALETVVAATAGPLRVVTTHLEYYSLPQRAAEIAGLRAIHAEACGHATAPRPDDGVDAPFKAEPRPAAAVFCGDFNCPPDAPELAALSRPQGPGVPPLLDAWPLARPAAARDDTVGLHGCEWPDHPYCCDYFFVSENLADAVAGFSVNQDTAASDHQPIMLELARWVAHP